MKTSINLGRDPVPKLVLRLALPTMLAQLVSVLYSIVDRMYIGAGVGDLALAGVGVCGPIVTLIASFATLIGLGGAPLLAIRMGEDNMPAAEHILANAHKLLIILSAVLTVLAFLLKDHLLMWFGASSATFPFADRYLSVYLFGTFFALLSGGMNSFLIAQGFSGLGMTTVMLGAALNIVLDPIFIFALHLGVAGAAAATVLSQLASCIFVLLALRSKKMPVQLHNEKLDGAIARRIFTFGLSPFLIIALDSVLLIALNALLQYHGGPAKGDLLVTCATIVQSYYLLISLPLGGLTLGAQPVISFNYGARQTKRIFSAFRTIIGVCLLFCGLMTIVTYTLSPYFVRLFTRDAATGAQATLFIKQFTCMIIPLAIQYPMVDETTALGQVRLSLFCSLFRKCVFFLMMFLLPTLFRAETIFFSEPIADLLSAIMSTVLVLHFIPPMLRRHAAEDKPAPAAQP